MELAFRKMRKYNYMRKRNPHASRKFVMHFNILKYSILNAYFPVIGLANEMAHRLLVHDFSFFKGDNQMSQFELQFDISEIPALATRYEEAQGRLDERLSPARRTSWRAWALTPRPPSRTCSW